MYSLKERLAGRKGSDGQRDRMRSKCWEIVLDAGGDCDAVAFNTAADAAFVVLVLVIDLEVVIAIEGRVIGFGGIWRVITME